MQTIEINTTQNVVIEYDLADLRDRIIAYFIDLFVIGVSISIISLITTLVFQLDGDLVYFLISFPILVFYAPVMEYRMKGQSPGKKAMNIKIIKMNGEDVDLSACLARWAFRALDIYLSLGSIASILVNSSRNKQRIGDITANTTVIRLKSNYSLSLSQILNINTTQTYQPKYTGVKQLREEDVLLVKTTLDRLHNYRNRAHEEAAELLATRIKELLNLTDVNQVSEEFLRTVINDYIVLTR